jgi:uncharacterized membrane protein YoaK (UPF0700 family)
MRLVARIRRPNITSTFDFAICVLPFVLSLIAGSTDVIGFLGLNGLFTAHITGNLVVLAARVVAGDRTVLSYLLSVPVFMLVLFLTSLFASGLRRFGVSTLRPLLLLQLIFIVAFFMLCVIPGPWRDANATLAIVAGMAGGRRDGGAERACADLAEAESNDGSDDDQRDPFLFRSEPAANRSR